MRIVIIKRRLLKVTGGNNVSNSDIAHVDGEIKSLETTNNSGKNLIFANLQTRDRLVVLNLF